MTIDCRQCRHLLESDAAETESALLEHLEQCPDCARQLENAIARETTGFPGPAWETPPSWSPNLVPTCTRQEASQPSIWSWVRTALQPLRPAFAGLALAGILTMAVLWRSPAGSPPIPETVDWSFFSPQDLVSSLSFIHEEPAETAPGSNAETLDGIDPAGFPATIESEPSSEEEAFSLMSRQEWSFLDSGNSFTFIDEEETS